MAFPKVFDMLLGDDFAFITQDDADLDLDQDVIIDMTGSQFVIIPDNKVPTEVSQAIEAHELAGNNSDSPVIAGTDPSVTVGNDPSVKIIQAEATAQQDKPLSDDSPVTNNVPDPKAGLHTFIKQQMNKNTARKTDSCVRKFREWLLSAKSVETDPVHIDPEQLDILLGEWFMGLKRNDGSDYEPDSLTAFHRGICRYLKDNGYGVNIVEDHRFETSSRVLAAKRKQLKYAGYGNKPNKAEPISDEHFEQMWAKGVMGLQTAKSLQNLLWFFLTEGFGLRAPHEEK